MALSNTNHTGEDSNITSAHYMPYSNGEVLTMSITFTVIGTCALLSNSVITWVICSHKKFHTAGYALLISLSIAESIALISRVFLALPASILYYFYATRLSTTYFGIIGDILQIGAYGQMSHLLCIAVNRLCSVLAYTRYKLLFAYRRTAVAIVLCWVYSVIWLIARLVGASVTRYDPVLLTWTQDPSPENRVYQQLTSMAGTVTLVGMVILYAVMIVKIKSAKTVGNQLQQAESERAARRRKEELRLSIQFTLVSLVYAVVVILTISIWFAMPEHPPEHVVKAASASYNAFFFVNYSVNPLIYFIFNPSLREACAAAVMYSGYSLDTSGVGLSGASVGSTGGKRPAGQTSHIAVRALHESTAGQ